MDSAVAARLKKLVEASEASESKNISTDNLDKSKLQNDDDIKSNEIELAIPAEDLQATK